MTGVVLTLDTDAAGAVLVDGESRGYWTRLATNSCAPHRMRWAEEIDGRRDQRYRASVSLRAEPSSCGSSRTSPPSVGPLTIPVRRGRDGVGDSILSTAMSLMGLWSSDGSWDTAAWPFEAELPRRRVLAWLRDAARVAS